MIKESGTSNQRQKGQKQLSLNRSGDRIFTKQIMSQFIHNGKSPAPLVMSPSGDIRPKIVASPNVSRRIKESAFNENLKKLRSSTPVL